MIRRYPPPDEVLLRLLTEEPVPLMADIGDMFGVSDRTVRTWARAARARHGLPPLTTAARNREPARFTRKDVVRTQRKCLYCGRPHQSTGPGDRYHPNCREQVRAQGSSMAY